MVPWPHMRSRCLALGLLVVSQTAFAQADAIFGSGKAPIFREDDLDKRFARSRLGKALKGGADVEGCTQVLGGLLTALGEAAPYFHKRDEEFILDPALVRALATQLSTPRFSAISALQSMVRRVRIDKELPAEWLDTARAIAPHYALLDVAKLEMLSHGVQPIDSFHFGLPVLKDRFEVEVTRANSIAVARAAEVFRDTYLDRDVTWGGLVLDDTGWTGAKKKKGKNAGGDDAELVALLYWFPPKPKQGPFGGGPPPPKVKVVARLQPRQYSKLESLPRGSLAMVKGRFWETTRNITEVEVRDALIFREVDWRKAVLGSPAAVEDCAAAFNEVTGTAPTQLHGFEH